MLRGKHNNHVRGEQHYRWNHGRMLSDHGYVKVRVGVGHPLADPNGYAYEHLLAWAQAGYTLPNADQIIHHRNGDKADNRIDNLELMSRTDHAMKHHVCLTDDQVRVIRQMYADKAFSMVTLGRMFHVSTKRISKYIRGETRARAGGPMSTDNRYRVGKGKAGRRLDGKKWNEVPA